MERPRPKERGRCWWGDKGKNPPSRWGRKRAGFPKKMGSAFGGKEGAKRKRVLKFTVRGRKIHAP